MVKKIGKAPSLMLSIRLSAEERKTLEKAAAAEDRPLAYVARRAILEWLKTKGFLK
jgi:predicted transcriptional regulator